MNPKQNLITDADGSARVTICPYGVSVCCGILIRYTGGKATDGKTFPKKIKTLSAKNRAIKGLVMGSVYLFHMQWRITRSGE
jgi:hypothetical protein